MQSLRDEEIRGRQLCCQDRLCTSILVRLLRAMDIRSEVTVLNSMARDRQTDSEWDMSMGYKDLLASALRDGVV